MNNIVNIKANQGKLETVGNPIVAENSTVGIAVSLSDEWDGLDVSAVIENEMFHQMVAIEDGSVVVPDGFVVPPHFFITLTGGQRMTSSKLEIKVQPTLKGVDE